jgi:dihydrofolate synthase / folylpolyglutamate synthase
MTYEEALAYIHGAKYTGKKNGLKNITILMDKLGNQQDSLRFVHIAGTNGKGSTGAFISSVLTEAGFKTGFFSSPYLERFTERIRIDGEEISETELTVITAEVRDKVSEIAREGGEMPSEFEIITAIGFIYFEREKCDFVVLETGLGGRFDSTNVIKTSEAVVITAIDYDHMQFLGDTLEQIAFEKAGIIKPGNSVVLYDSASETRNVFETRCSEAGAKLYPVDFSRINSVKSNEYGQKFDFEQYSDLRLKMLGKHQLRNAATAIKTCEILNDKEFIITVKALRQGLAKAFWKGRLERVSENPLIIIDGAHNINGAKALNDFVLDNFTDRKIICVAGILQDKEYKDMIMIMSGVCDKFILPGFDNDRAASPQLLAGIISEYCLDVEICRSIDDFLDKYLISGKSEIFTLNKEVYIIFGSLYFIGDLRKKLYERKSLQ